ncbi:MAG: hypothetical protein ABJG42_24195 [Vibrio splendidus]
MLTYALAILYCKGELAMDSEKSSANKIVKRLTPREYSSACQMWASGDYRLKDIAEVYGVSVQALQKRFKKDQISKGQNANLHSAAVKEALEGESVRTALETRKVIQELQQNNLTWLEQLTKRSLMIAAKSSKDNIPLGNFKDDVKVLKDISDIVTKNYMASASILRIDEMTESEEELPTFRVEEMTADDVEEVREAQRRQLAELVAGDSELLDDGEEIVIETDGGD